MPLFTIGIPTYNRANYLKRSLECAVSQTHPDLEIIVSDNASTDETHEVVKSFGDRVRYHRNPMNLGATANLEKVLELATGEYFSWLQDDDLIHRDFARRAYEALAVSDDVTAYACFSIRTPSATTLFHAFLTGPAVPLAWMQGGITLMDGILVAPVSLFYSFGNPPALAFRTRAIRRAIGSVRHRCTLYDERILLAASIADGRVAVDPWPGAVFTFHPGQDHLRIFRTDPGAQAREWYVLADALGELLEGRGDSWKEPVMELFRAADLEHRIHWLNTYCPDAEAHRKAHPIASEVWAMLVETIPADLRHKISGFPQPRSLRGRAKLVLWDLTPPVVWRTIRKAKRRSG